MHSITVVLHHLSTLVSLTSVRCKIHKDPSNRTALSSAPISHLVSCKASDKTKRLLGRGLRSMMNTAIGLLGKLNSVKVNSRIRQCAPLLPLNFKTPWFLITK